MKTNSLHSLSEKILEVYVTNIRQLSCDMQRHFVYRLSQIGKPIESEIEKSAVYTQQQLDAGFINSVFNEQIIRTQISSFPIIKINDAKKIESFQRVPQLFSLYLALKELFYCKYFQLIENPIQYLERIINIPELLDEIDQDFFTSATTYVVCIFYYLKYLGYYSDNQQFNIKNLTLRYTPKDESPIYKMNYLYGLTHLVIGDSYFYQRRPSKELNWVSDGLEKFQDYVFEADLDLHVEVALALLMLDHKSSHIMVANAIERIKSKVDGNSQIVKRSNLDTLIRAEHTNTLVLLLNYYLA